MEIEKDTPLSKSIKAETAVVLILICIAFSISVVKAGPLSNSSKVLFRSDNILGTFDFNPWSPNGNLFAGLIYADDKSTHFPKGILAIVDITSREENGARLIELPPTFFPANWISSGQWADDSLGLYLHPADSRDIVYFDIRSERFLALKQLDNDVSYFRVSPRGDSILYVSSGNTGNKLYVLSNDGDEVLVASDVDPLTPRWLSERRFVYSKDASLFLMQHKHNVLRMLGDVSSIEGIKEIFPVTNDEFVVSTSVLAKSGDREEGCLLGSEL